MKKGLLLIICVILLFGCSNTLVSEFAVVKKVNKNSIVVENLGGQTTEVAISPTTDFTFEENKEYFFKYEIHKGKKAVLISAESSED